VADTTDAHRAERKRYEQAISEAADAAVDACITALKAIGIYPSVRLQEALHRAISENL